MSSKPVARLKVGVTRTNLAVAAACAVMLGAVGIRGGLGSADSDRVVVEPVPGLADSDAQPVKVTAVPLDIEVRRSYVVDGARVVEMDVMNKSPRPFSAYNLYMGVRLLDSDLPENEQPEIREQLVRRISNEPLQEVPEFGSVPMNPGVPMKLALVFTDQLDYEEQPVKAADADTLKIWSREYRKTPLDGSTDWWLGDVAAELVLK